MDYLICILPLAFIIFVLILINNAVNSANATSVFYSISLKIKLNNFTYVIPVEYFTNLEYCKKAFKKYEHLLTHEIIFTDKNYKNLYNQCNRKFNSINLQLQVDRVKGDINRFSRSQQISWLNKEKSLDNELTLLRNLVITSLESLLEDQIIPVQYTVYDAYGYNVTYFKEQEIKNLKKN